MKKILSILLLASASLLGGCGVFGLTGEQKREMLDSVRPVVQYQLDRALEKVFEEIEEKVVKVTKDLDISEEAKAKLTELVVNKTKEAAEGVAEKVTETVIEKLDDVIPEQEEESKVGGVITSLLGVLGPILLGGVRRG